MNNGLKYVSDWPEGNGLNLNPNKCAQCMFSLKGNAVIDLDLKANINGNALSTVESVTYLGVTFSNNAKWTTHVDEIGIKCAHLSFFVKKLGRLSTLTEFIRKFVDVCALPFIFNCSLAILPELLKHDLALLKRSIKLISHVYGLSFSHLTNLVVLLCIMSSP